MSNLLFKVKFDFKNIFIAISYSIVYLFTYNRQNFSKMSSTPMKKPDRFNANNKGYCSVFGIKASIIIVGFLLLVAVLSLSYLSFWTIVTKHKYALLASAYLYTTATYRLLLSSIITCVAIIVLFITSWNEYEKGLKFVSLFRIRKWFVIRTLMI